jgi:hypothetical protein
VEASGRLVGPPVFKTGEGSDRPLAGSIPVRLRQPSLTSDFGLFALVRTVAKRPGLQLGCDSVATRTTAACDPIYRFKMEWSSKSWMYDEACRICGLARRGHGSLDDHPGHPTLPPEVLAEWPPGPGARRLVNSFYLD